MAVRYTAKLHISDCDKEMMVTAGPVRNRLYQQAKAKSLRMTALIVAAFIVCWTPYQVVFIAHTFMDPDSIDARYEAWVFFFGMANSMVNPLIYGAYHLCSRRRHRSEGLQRFFA